MSLVRAGIALAAMLAVASPLFFSACNGSTCFRESDCMNGQACMAGNCSSITSGEGGGDAESTEGSVSTGSDANDTTPDSATFDAQGDTDSGTTEDTGTVDEGTDAGTTTETTDAEADAG
jgi:hypothetical protein